MADTNWIKLNRNIQDSFIWNFEKPQFGLAWVDMLMLANYKDKQILFNGKVLTIKRGSFVSSTVKLAERWHMNRRTVKAFLDVLKSDGMITYECTARCTTVFIVNYEKYQGFADFNDEDDAQLDAQANAQLAAQLDAQLTAHNIRNKEIKECKEENKYSANSSEQPEPPKPSEKPKKPTVAEVDAFFETVWNLYPVKKGKGQVSAAKRTALYSVGLEEMKRAIDRYMRDLKKDASWRKPQNGSTFFNSGYVDYLDKNYEPMNGGGTDGGNPEHSGQDQQYGTWL